MYKKVQRNYMGKDMTHQTNVKLAEMWQEAANSAFLINGMDRKLTSSTYTRKASLQKVLHFKSEFVMVEPTLLPSLSPGAQKLVISIMAELKRNNALWFCEYRLKARI